MDDIDWTEEPFAELLVPLGEYDYERQIEPQWRNTVTEAVGLLGELSAKPGATWEAPWAGVRSTRLSDGSVFIEQLPGGVQRPEIANSSNHNFGIRERPADLLRSP
jgi:hypothetical protein